MKKLIPSLLLTSALILAAFSLSGCFNASEDESEIPWTRPHSWENTAPGMGGQQGNTF